jgi:hypothetical protein
MTKTFSFFFISLFLASCGGGSGSGSNGSATGSISGNMSEAELSTGTTPVEAQTFDISANLTGFEREEEEKIYQAFDLIKKVVASDSFKKQVLGHTYKGKKQFFDNGGASNAEVYQAILAGAEKLSPASNNTMDINLESYYEGANVIGYTKPSIETIYVNRRYLAKDSFTVNKVAMNLTHEWLHKLGFKHAQNNSSSRPHSVPYAVGYIMRDLAAKLI